MNNNKYFKTALEGLFKILFSTFIPLVFWSYKSTWVNNIESWLHIAKQFQPIFLSTILITLPGTLIYPFFQWIFRRIKLVLKYTPKTNINLSVKSPSPRDLKISVSFEELPSVSWGLIKHFHLTFTVVAVPDIVLVKCADRQSSKYYRMNSDGNLEVDITSGVEETKEKTSVDIPVILHPYINTGEATLKVKGKGGLLYQILAIMIVPNIKIKVS